MSAESVYRRSPVWLQNVLLNAHALRIERHRYGPPYRSALATLGTQERWEKARISAYQDRQVQDVIQRGYERSTYYRALLDGIGIRPEQITATGDLRHLPMLEKETVRRRQAEMITSRPPRADWLEGHTSGTTGTPLGVWYDRQTCILTNAVDRAHKRWAGVAPEDWVALLLGRVVVPPTQTRAPFWRTNRVQRQVWFSSFHMSEENLDRYIDEIRRRQIQVIEGYPSTLFVLASHLLRRGTRLPMRAVISSSETLHPLQRERIEAAFERKLFDFYALAERVVYAAECEAHEGKHLAETYGYAEIVDEEGRPVPDGEPGYLAGTSLHNTAMPMIRYRTSDVTHIIPEPCSCGRASRRIADVSTKAEDLVVTPDGRLISPSILTHPFKPLEQIAASQIVQERPDHLLVKIVPTAEFTDLQQQTLITSLAERLGPAMTIEIQLVTAIPREASGKYRWVISRVKHDCALNWSAIA